MPVMFPNPAGRRAWFILAATLIALATLLARKADDPLREYGEPHQDAEYLLAGERFARDGFIANRFVPFKQVENLDDAPLGEHYEYLHSQPLAFAANGFLQKMGLRSVPALRMAGVLLHLLGLACVFLLVRRGTGDGMVAALAAGLTAFSNPFYAHADSVAWYSGMLFFTFAPLTAWLYAQRNGRAPSRAAWWGVGALFFVQSLYVLITQSGFYCLAFLGLYALAFGTPFPKWKLVFFGVPYAAGAFVILARNAWHVGFRAAWDDLTDIVLHRIFGAPLSAAPESAAEAAVSAGYYAPWDAGDWAWTAMERFSRIFFGFRGWAGLAAFACIVAVLFYRLWKIPDAERTEKERTFYSMLKFGLVCLGAALPFALVFMQNVVTHHFPSTDATVGFAVLLATLLWRLSWNKRRLAMALAVVFVLGSVADCVRKEVTRPGHFGELAKIGEALPADAVIGMSTVHNAPAYYARRPYVRALERPEDIEDFRRRASAQFPERPLYFLLSRTAVFPYEDIRRHLDARYPMEMEVGGFRPTRVYRMVE